MQKILITGFSPFGSSNINPSAEAAMAMPERLSGATVGKIILPVVWGKAWNRLKSEIEVFKPDAVMMLGQAGGAAHVRIERVAMNICSPIADTESAFNEGEKRETPVVLNAPNAYFSSCDCESVLNSIKQCDIPVMYSFSAGTYLCNYIYYNTLHYFKTVQGDGEIPPVVFIHLPQLPCQAQNAPTMSPENEYRAVYAAAEAIISMKR